MVSALCRREVSCLTPKDRVRERLGLFFRRFGVGKGSAVVSLLGLSDAEIAVYDKLKVRREDITVIERSPGVWREQGKKQWGSQLFLGTLREFACQATASKPQIPIDAINADFMSTMWECQDELARLLPLLCDGSARCLAVTSLGRRDHVYMNVAKMAVTQVRSLAGRVYANAFFSALERQYDTALPDGARSVFRPEREVAFAWWLAVALERTAFTGKRFMVDAVERYIYRPNNSSSLHTWFVHFKPAPVSWNIQKALIVLTRLFTKVGITFLDAQ